MRSPYDAPEAASDARPQVIVWYRVYAAFMACVYLGALAYSLLLASRMSDPEIAMSPGAAQLQLVVLLVLLLSLAFGVFFVVAMLVPFKPWGWTIGAAAIALGLLGGTFPFAVALLVFWIKPTTKAAFGRL